MREVVENTMYLKQLGYAPPSFPGNFREGRAGGGFPMLRNLEGEGRGGTVRCNDGTQLRKTAAEIKYGREMTNWRRSRTDGDKKPFETVGKG